MKILFIGDIFAKAGRKAVNDNLKLIKEQTNFDYCIANVENTTHGRSISIKHYDFLKNAGIDFMTLGNHTWENDDINYLLQNKTDIIRPLNIKKSLPESSIGYGTKVVKICNKSVRITNLIGATCFCKDMQTNPFIALEELVATDDKSDIHIIDLHTETTSEKKAMLIQFSGKVSAILGTHTHVPTADDQIFNNTAFITDVGMTGPKNGIIGAKPETIIAMFNEKIKRFKLEPAVGEYQFNSVLLSFDDKSNTVIAIQRISINNN